MTTESPTDTQSAVVCSVFDINSEYKAVKKTDLRAPKTMVQEVHLTAYPNQNPYCNLPNISPTNLRESLSMRPLELALKSYAHPERDL